MKILIESKRDREQDAEKEIERENICKECTWCSSYTAFIAIYEEERYKHA